MPPYIEVDVNGKPASVSWGLDNVIMNEVQRNQRNVQPPDMEAWNKQCMWCGSLTSWSMTDVPRATCSSPGIGKCGSSVLARPSARTTLFSTRKPGQV